MYIANFQLTETETPTTYCNNIASQFECCHSNIYPEQSDPKLWVWLHLNYEYIKDQQIEHRLEMQSSIIKATADNYSKILKADYNFQQFGDMGFLAWEDKTPDGFKYLTIRRDFNREGESNKELIDYHVNPKLLLYGNLRKNSGSNYVFWESGETVIRITEQGVAISLDYLKDFLAGTNSYAFLQIQGTLTHDEKESGLVDGKKEISRKLEHFQIESSFLETDDFTRQLLTSHNHITYIRGKIIIEPYGHTSLV